MKLSLPTALLASLFLVAVCARADTYYVSYYGTNTIEQFAPDGTDLGAFPAAGLNGPQGIAFDSHGNLYVANSNNTILEFSPTGASLGIFTNSGLSGPVNIVFDSSGNLYAANYNSNSVEKFSPAGANLGVFAQPNSGAWGLAFDSGGNLCVSDKGNNSVQKFSPTGANLGTFISTNLAGPTGLAFDLTGNLYVANQGSNTIQIFSPAGVNLGQVAVSGLNAPTGLFFDSGGNLFICDALNNKIRKVSPTGVDLGTFATTGSGSTPSTMIVRSGLVGPALTGSPSNLTVHNGNPVTLTVTATGTGLSYQWQKNGVNLSDGGTRSGTTSPTLQISAVAPGDAGQYRAIVSNAGGAIGSTPATLLVLAPAPAPPGTFFVSYYSANTIEEFSPAGVDLGAFANTGLNNPQGMALDSGGNLYVVNAHNNAIEKFSPTGVDLGVFANTGLNNPVDLVIDQNGNFYASNNSGDTVEKFSPVGMNLGAFVHPSQAWGLAFDSGGNLYVSNQDLSNVQKYSPAGASLGTFATTNVSHPTGLAFDPTGRLFVSNQGSNTIQIYSTAGANVGQVAVSNLNGPCGLLFDSGGNLFICDANNNEIRKVSPTGVDLGVFANTGSGTSPNTIIVQPGPFAPNITTQPTPLTVVATATAVFTIGATGSPAPSIQWQLSTDGGNTWSNLTDGGNISGSATSTLSLANSTAVMLGQQFRAIATNPSGSATSNPATLTVDTPPAITTQPASQAIIVGNLTTFSAAATGYPAPSFQWQISTDGGNTWSNLTDGGNISGSATANLSIGNTSSAMLGNQFRALAINSAGTTPTSAAILTVNSPPAITTPPANVTVIAGNTTIFAAAASGFPVPSFQWQLSIDGGNTWSNLTDNATYSGSATANLSVANTTAAMSGYQFQAVATNAYGSATSSPGVLTVDTVPVITTQPGNQTVIVGNSTTFTTTASGDPTPSFQWQLSTDGGNTWSNLTDVVNTTSGSATANLTLGNVTISMLGNQYRAIATNLINSAPYSATSNAATLNVLFQPQITSQPVSVAVFTGNTSTFSVSVTGNPVPSFQWYFNGKVITVNATSSSFTITNVTAGKTGNYTVVIANGIGGPITSAAAKLSLGVRPRIAMPPTNLTVDLNASANFTAVAAGTPAATYQWQVSVPNNGHWYDLANNATYSGVTNSTLTVSNVTALQSGYQFRVVASNLINDTIYTATSSAAYLTVYFPPVLTALTCGNLSSLNGGNQSILVSGNLAFSVTATGSALKYQWQLNGKNIPGATKSTYTLTKAATKNTGAYDVVVTNSLGSLISNTFVVTVLYPPAITTQPRSLTVKTGANATFTVVVNTASTTPLGYIWKFESSPLSDGPDVNGSNTSSLMLTDVTSANAGQYQVVISNIAGSLTSASATLIVK
jgi:sugar lactone lactonase YvrE